LKTLRGYGETVMGEGEGGGGRGKRGMGEMEE